VFVILTPGRTGLIPLSETGIAREADVAQALPVGTDVEVVVLEVDPTGRRIRLSRKAVLDAREAEEVREYTQHADVALEEKFGSLGDKIRRARKPREK
jgi:ribosomal protein S1